MHRTRVSSNRNGARLGRAWRLVTVGVVFALAVALIGQASAPVAQAQTREVAAPRGEAQAGDVVPGQYALRLADPADRAAAIARLPSGFQVVRDLESLGWLVVEDLGHSTATSVQHAQTRLAAVDGVADVEPIVIYRTSGLSHSPEQSGGHVVAAEASNDPLIWQQWGNYSVNATDAWEITQGAGVIVAVIDTGVDPTHEDLAANLLPGFDYVDDDADPTDEDGHGTHVAGTVAAVRNNALGGAGVAPQASILPVRVLGPGGGFGGDVAAGIEFAVNNGADVINLSLGSPSIDPLIQSAVAFAIANDVVVVATAGNLGLAQLRYPANYPGVIGVGALTPGGSVAGFSNTGTHVDVVAPGVSIWSAAPSAVLGVDYRQIDGTSMASPHVAGIAALLRASNPGFSQAQVAARIADTSIDIGAPGLDTSSGSGRVDAYRALTNGDDPEGDFFEIEIAHTYVADLQVNVLRVGQPERVLFMPNAFPYGQDDDIRVRYSLPDQGLDAVPGSWFLGALDVFPALDSGAIVGFRVHSSGVDYSYPGSPVAIENDPGLFTIVGVIVGNADADLSSLEVDPGVLDPSFEAGTTTYVAEVGNEIASIDVTATLSDPLASLTIGGGAGESGVAKAVPLAVGENSIDIVVTAENGETTKTYAVTVTRAAPGPSDDATLLNLEVSEGTLSPSFDSGVNAYSVDVPNAIDSIDVTATTNDDGATLEVNGSPAASGVAENVLLSVGPNAIEVDVTAEDGTPLRYTVTVTRADPPAADDATLASLTLSEGSLTPAFEPGTTDYTATVGNAVSSLELTAMTNDADAALQIDGSPADSGVAETIGLTVGENVILIDVTAEDGTTTERYTVTVTREALSTNADLSALSISPGTLNPGFDPDTEDYTVSVGNEVDSIDVAATVSDADGATLTVDGNPADSGVAETIGLAVGENIIPVEVTAEDGSTTRTYTVTVTRAAPPAPDDATLKELSLSSGSLNPAFAPGTTEYTANVSNGVTSVSVTATPTNSLASVAIDPASPVALAVGANLIEVEVTSEDTTVVEVYTITVTRAAAPPPPPPGGGGGGASQTVTPTLEVVNDDGGSASVDDFTVLLNGEAIELDEPATGSSGLNRLTVDGPVTLYAFTFSGDCDSQGFFSLAFGDALDCDIEADDLPLTVVLSEALPGAETLIDESLSFALDSFVVDGVRSVQASTAEENPLLTVTVPLSAVPGQSSVTVSVVEGNADAARFNPAAGTVFIAGMAYDIQILDTNGDPIEDFATPIELSFLLPEGVDASAVAAYFWDEEAGAWRVESGTVVDGRFVVSTSHLTVFALFEFVDGGGVRGSLPASGVSLQAAEGGTISQFRLATASRNVSAVFISHEGRLIGYLFDAPSFVNAEFLSVTGGVLSPGQGLMVVVGG